MIISPIISDLMMNPGSGCFTKMNFSSWPGKSSFSLWIAFWTTNTLLDKIVEGNSVAVKGLLSDTSFL